MGKAIGIDLGTTNSVAGIRVLKSEIIPNSESEKLTPSIVSYGSSNAIPGAVNEDVIVGRRAFDLLLQDPENTIRSVKRLMGRSIMDSEIQNLIQSSRLSYRLGSLRQGSKSSLAIQLKDGRELTPPEVSSEILKKIKRDAESFLKDQVTEAVITVPAYFNEKQKHATYQAAELAGFHVTRLLSEPSAAAIAYGVDQKSESQTVLIYDFGGGTLDISLLSFAGGHFMEQAKGGDMWLGGDDIDDLLRDFVARQLVVEFSLGSFTEFLTNLSPGDRLRLRGEIDRAATHAKLQLSEQNQVVMEINSSVKTPKGTRIQTDIEINRSQFAELLAPFVSRSELLVKQVLDSVHFSPEMVDQVLMVGGSSSILVFQNSLQKIFGNYRVKVHERPMLAIAEGAAILASKMSGQNQNSDLGEVLFRSAHDYYLQLANGQQMLLIERQTPLPVTVKKILKYEHVSQLLAHFCFSNKIDNRFEPIGELWLSHLPRNIGFCSDQKNPEIDLTLTVTEDELVKVEVSLVEHPEVFLSKTLSRSGEDEKLFHTLSGAIEDFNKSFQEGVQTQEAENRIFDFLYYSASLGQMISKEIPQGERNQMAKQVNKINQKIALAKELSLSQPLDSDDAQGHHWSRMVTLQAILRHFSREFDKDNLPKYRMLVDQALEEMRNLSGLERIEKALKEAQDFVDKYAPGALRMMHFSSAPEQIDSSYYASIRTGLNENTLSSL